MRRMLTFTVHLLANQQYSPLCGTSAAPCRGMPALPGAALLMETGLPQSKKAARMDQRPTSGRLSRARARSGAVARTVRPSGPVRDLCMRRRRREFWCRPRDDATAVAMACSGGSGEPTLLWTAAATAISLANLEWSKGGAIKVQLSPLFRQGMPRPSCQGRQRQFHIPVTGFRRSRAK